MTCENCKYFFEEKKPPMSLTNYMSIQNQFCYVNPVRVCIDSREKKICQYFEDKEKVNNF